MENEKLVLNTAEACELLQVSAPTLRELCRSKNAPPFIRVGKNYRFPRRELIEWFAEAAGERRSVI